MTGRDVLPEFNKEKLVDSFHTVLGSSSAITACVLAGLGAKVTFVGMVGKDDLGTFVKSELSRAGVCTDWVIDTDEAGTGVTLSLSTQVDRALLTYPGTISLLTTEWIPERMFEEADHIHFGSYFLQTGMLGRWKEVFRRAQEAGITTSFDTGWDPTGRWDREEIAALLDVTDYFIPSESEIMQLFSIASLSDLPAMLPQERREVIIKCGSRGCMHIAASGVITVADSFPVKPVDTTGAGDSFNAGYLFARLCHKDINEALRFGNASGALATQRVGGAGAVPSLAEIEDFMSIE